LKKGSHRGFLVLTQPFVTHFASQEGPAHRAAPQQNLL